MKIWHIATAVLALPLLAACGASPSSVTKQFYMDVSEGKIEDSLGLVDLQALQGKGVSREKLRAGIVSRSNLLNVADCGGIKDVKILSEDVRGEIAIQKVELLCKSGATKTTNAQLMKGKDGWRIVNI